MWCFAKRTRTFYQMESCSKQCLGIMSGYISMKVRDACVSNRVVIVSKQLLWTSRRMRVLTCFFNVSKYFVTVHVTVFEHSESCRRWAYWASLRLKKQKCSYETWTRHL